MFHFEKIFRYLLVFEFRYAFHYRLESTKRHHICLLLRFGLRTGLEMAPKSAQFRSVLETIMSYDPIRDASAFRTTLKRLAEIEHLTSQAIIDLFAAQRNRGDNLSISRATLDRFVQGEDITRIRELRVIHEILRIHPTYGTYFEQAIPEAARAAPVPLLARTLAEFLLPGGSGRDGVQLDDMTASLPGQYVMMRRDHDAIAVESGVRVSSLLLQAAEGTVVIEETQSYRTPDYEVPFEQTDRGYVFTHNRYIYFLMKEVGGAAVKFGVIDLVLPELDRRQPVQYFQGYLMVVSRRGVFPRTRFAARRYSPNQHPMTSGIVRLSEIVDSRAMEHLRQDYVEGAAARPAFQGGVPERVFGGEESQASAL